MSACLPTHQGPSAHTQAPAPPLALHTCVCDTRPAAGPRPPPVLRSLCLLCLPAGASPLPAVLEPCPRAATFGAPWSRFVGRAYLPRWEPEQTRPPAPAWLAGPCCDIIFIGVSKRGLCPRCEARGEGQRGRAGAGAPGLRTPVLTPRGTAREPARTPGLGGASCLRRPWPGTPAHPWESAWGLLPAGTGLSHSCPGIHAAGQAASGGRAPPPSGHKGLARVSPSLRWATAEVGCAGPDHLALRGSRLRPSP